MIYSIDFNQESSNLDLFQFKKRGVKWNVKYYAYLYCCHGFYPVLRQTPKFCQGFFIIIAARLWLIFWLLRKNLAEFSVGANIGGEKRQYALFFIGDNKRNSAEICYRLIGSEPAPFDDPASVIGTICEIKLPFESREEKNKAARYASRITLITLFIYEQYQDFSRVVFPSVLPKKSIYRRGIKKERKNF